MPKKSFAQKYFKIIIFIVLFSVLSYLISPTKANAESSKLKWLTTECQTKCQEIKTESLAKIAEKIQKLENQNPPDDQAIENARKSRQEIQAWICDQNHDGLFSDCLAPPIAVDLQVPLGGATVAAGLVSHIITLYTWGVRTIAVIAVLLIMFSGIQWLTSAGSSDAISKAKNRIKGAVIGLILVLLSVGLLNFINPALTNLSGFQVKMIPTLIQGTFWCRDIKPAPELFIKSINAGKYTEAGASAVIDEHTYTQNDIDKGEKVGTCNVSYEFTNGDEQTCYGEDCHDEKSVCVPYTLENFKCQEAIFYGQVDESISSAGLFALDINFSATAFEPVLLAQSDKREMQYRGYYFVPKPFEEDYDYNEYFFLGFAVKETRLAIDWLKADTWYAVGKSGVLTDSKGQAIKLGSSRGIPSVIPKSDVDRWKASNLLFTASDWLEMHKIDLPPADTVIKSGKACPAECGSLCPGHCTFCDNCVALDPVPYKDGSQANSELKTKITKAYSQSIMDGIGYWRVTEAWSPVVKHASQCHYNGTCVDVAFTKESAKTSPSEIDKLYGILRSYALFPIYETSDSGLCSQLSSIGVPCRQLSVDPHFHVE